MMLLSNVLAPNDGVQVKEDNTCAFIDGRNAGNGTLYITENQVSWLTEAGQGIDLEYPKICLHAISRDLNSFPQECLYLQVEGKLLDDREEGDNSSDEDDDSPVTEVRFVPADKGTLDVLFTTMSDCQALHPDPEDADSEEEGQGEGEGQFFQGAEDESELTPQGRATLQHLENLLHAGQGDNTNTQTTNGTAEAMDDDGQFDDADMEM